MRRGRRQDGRLSSQWIARSTTIAWPASTSDAFSKERNRQSYPLKDGKYRVRLDSQWIEVPPDALVTAPNKFGLAVVWPYKDYESRTQIRCFIPGARRLSAWARTDAALSCAHTLIFSSATTRSTAGRFSIRSLKAV